jgi:hypothetical protein
MGRTYAVSHCMHWRTFTARYMCRLNACDKHQLLLVSGRPPIGHFVMHVAHLFTRQPYNMCAIQNCSACALLLKQSLLMRM